MRKRRDVPIARETTRRQADLDLFGPPDAPQVQPELTYSPAGGAPLIYEELGDAFPGASPT